MRPRLKLSEIKPGDIIIADDGFTCIEPGRRCGVFSGPATNQGSPLYVRCCGDRVDFTEGDATGSTNYTSPHYLDGQVDFDDPDFIVGFSR